MKLDREESAYRVRVEAAEQARNRKHKPHRSNPDEERYGFANYLMNFTKGLQHDPGTGVVADPNHFKAFRTCIDEGYVEPFTSRLFVPTEEGRRKWEAPTAGVVFDLQGPDAQAVTMAPAPELCSDELTFEIAEVYELALLRDVPLSTFDEGGGSKQASLDASIKRLSALQYAKDRFPNRPRKTGCSGVLDRQTAFRGSSPGVEVGPYVSQFLWIGNDDCHDMGDGYITYGAQTINQRVPIAKTGEDHMQDWMSWLRVQNGYDVNGCSKGQTLDCKGRFICTPRDLATYVHFDALYQAYLNATLILLGMETPFDPGFAKLSGQRNMYKPGDSSGTDQNAGGFALWGGPHILTLVTEVATRALKAVRYQKFNNHLRLRPEALAGRIAQADKLEKKYPGLCGCLKTMKKDLTYTLKSIDKHNGPDAKLPGGNHLLPMAFAEGSPMHPTYGAGHATVAGACTTIVKAFFDTGTVFGKNAEKGHCKFGKYGFYPSISSAGYFEPDAAGKKLSYKSRKGCALTLEGELNKLAANISIGRNMAGVHYYSDYYDSLRMGEEIAIGMLEEQALCYPTDDFVMTVPTFDGDQVRIGAR
ncbi:MAG: vanadium-dependent haloperoxidase [Pseudomonadota bacterium]